MSTAKGPSSGYIFQFEISLLILADLKHNESISIECIDDVAKLDKNGNYLTSFQAKHSIISSGKTFGSTSSDLWKTINIWITNIKNGKLNKTTRFEAISNKDTPQNSIIRKFGLYPFDNIIDDIEKIKDKQIQNRDKKLLLNEKVTSVNQTIKRIKYALDNKYEFEIIYNQFSLKIYDNNSKENFYNKLNLGGYSELKKIEFYHSFLGWIQDKSKECWLNGSEAIFSKQDFDLKFNSLRDIYLLKKLYFREKELLQNNIPKTTEVDRQQIFIKQLDDINRFEKEEIIEEAIIDLLCKNLEMAHIISSNDPLTRDDFLKFEEKCIFKWKETVRSFITKPRLEDYSAEELNSIAIKTYDRIMLDLHINFKDETSFTDSDKYIKNGTFLTLSNEPIIGWHPNWKKNYK
jgi:hypothetical protein